MPRDLGRRDLLRGTVGASLAAGAAPLAAGAADAPKPTAAPLPMGKIGGLSVSRMLLGGNLLTHFTHSRDLRYVYRLTRHYNTPEKIIQTLETAETHGVNTLVVHTANNYSAWQPGGVIHTLQRHRKNGGKMQWIICPTAPLNKDFAAYRKMVKRLAETGCEAVYLWGVYADRLAAKGEADLIAGAVQAGRDVKIPSGVGAHDLKVVRLCEEKQIDADFYIKTFHSHAYPTAPKKEELKGATAEIPGYWCRDPQETADVMKTVTKPWIAFKVMAAGAIPPAKAFPFVFRGGADHTLAGMFDFEIQEDAAHVKKALAEAGGRERPWRS